ncbi:TPA: MarC family protein [Candidatus Bathyarchaeota archaeon]|nr:MarC family protein [Candidatus Bathyarchaeota archaeon]
MFDDLITLLAVLTPALIKGVISLFIVVDPIGSIPIFISLTEHMKDEEKRKAFNTATVVGLILLLAFALTGQQILLFFGISFESFMIAGGLLLLIIAIRLLVNGGWRVLKIEPESVGAVPIACPLLVGPGAITTTILNLQEMGIIVTTTSVLIIFLVVWIILRFINPIYMVLGKVGSSVISKVMALFIAAIAVQYMIDGLSHLTA